MRKVSLGTVSTRDCWRLVGDEETQHQGQMTRRYQNVWKRVWAKLLQKCCDWILDNLDLHLLGVALFPIAWWFHWKGSKEALESVGLWNSFQAAQLDRCIWNYQTDSSCRADLDCRHVPCPTCLHTMRESTIFSTCKFPCIRNWTHQTCMLQEEYTVGKGHCHSHAICLGCKRYNSFYVWTYVSVLLRSECITSLHENGAMRRNVISCNSGKQMRKCANSWESQKSCKKRNSVFFVVWFVFEANILCSQSSGFAKGLAQLYQADSDVCRHRRENLLQRQTISRPPPTEEERRWAREGRGSSYVQVVTTVYWKFHCLEMSKGTFFNAFEMWGRLLKHSAGLCLRPSEEDDGTLMLLSCSFPPVGGQVKRLSAFVPSCQILREIDSDLQTGRAEYSCGGVRESSLPP